MLQPRVKYMSLTKLHGRKSQILAFPQKQDVTGFFLQDLLKFLSVAGTLKDPGNGLNLGFSAAVDERYLTHPILRVLLENYFLCLWLFDDLGQSSSRYDKVLGKFADDYRKLWNEITADPAFTGFMAGAGSVLPDAASLRLAQGSLPDVRSMLSTVKGLNGTRSTDLYVLYRITSFDVHGRSLASMIETAFSQTGLHFPILDVSTAIDQMSVDYETILDDLIDKGMV